MPLSYFLFAVVTLMFIVTAFFYIKKKKVRFTEDKRFDNAIVFYITFLGVFLGIFFGNMNSSEKDTEQLIKLLETAKSDIELSKEDVLHTWLKRNALTKEVEKCFFMKNAYTEPISLNILLQKDFVVQNITPSAWNILLLRNKDISNTLIGLIKSTSDQSINHATMLRMSYDVMTNTQEIIDAEIEYQKSWFFPPNVEDKIKQLDESKRSNGGTIINAEQFNVDSLVLDQLARELQKKKNVY